MCDDNEIMKKGDNDSELIHLTVQKLTGEGSREELAKLEELLTKNETNKQLHDEIVKAWGGTEKVAGVTAEEAAAEWTRLRDAMRETPSEKSSFPLLKIAASVVLIMAVGLVFFFSTKENQTIILAQQIQTEMLADGSSVTLNADAELRYEPNFGEQSREVNLSGEAFFEVERDSERPFIIRTTSLEIKVLGTSFNVRAIEDEPSVEVVVVSGSVEISSETRTIQLGAGERGILNQKTGQLFKTVNDDVNFMSWKTKQFTFEDMALEQVIGILNNAFQLSIYLKNPEIRECPVTVSFENQSLESILEVLKITLDLAVQETSKGIEISGNGC